MFNDDEKVTLDYALRTAKYYYPKDKYYHAIRVMQYIADNEMIPPEYREDCLKLAVMHDLLEDTEYKDQVSYEIKDNGFIGALNLLTKPKDMDYNKYIRQIRDTKYTIFNVSKYWKICAWWVKLADIKDHLSQTETLTETLRDKYLYKYLSALPYLL